MCFVQNVYLPTMPQDYLTSVRTSVQKEEGNATFHGTHAKSSVVQHFILNA